MSEDTTLDEFGQENRSEVASDVQDGWRRQQLSEISHWTDAGGTPRTSNDEYWDGDIPWVQTGELTKRHIRSTEKQITELGLEESTAKRFPRGTLLIGMYGEPTVGESALLEIEATTNQACCGIFPDPDTVNAEFLHQMMQHEKPRLYSLRAGSGQQNIRQGIIRKFEIDVPPLSEQRKIATVLYTVDRAIEKTEEIIGQTRRVKQGVMDNVFEKGYHEHSGYDEVRIGPFDYEMPEGWDLCSIEESKGGENGLRRGPFGGMLKKDIFVDEGYKVYQQQNVIYDDFEYGDYYITDEKFRDMERFSVSAGDILISCSGTLGKVAVVPENYEEGVINQALLKFTVDEDIFQTQYIKYFLESKIGQRQLVLSSRGSAMKNMAPMEFVRSAQIFKPPIDEQSRISDALLSLDKKVNIEKIKKRYLEELKQGLMQDLLSGTVRTTDTTIQVPEEITKYG